MSATPRQDNRKALQDHLEIGSPVILTGSLARRLVMMQCVISGDEVSSMKWSAGDNFKQDQHTQMLLYTNSKTNAEGSLLNTADSLLKKINVLVDPLSYLHRCLGAMALSQSLF